MSLRVGVDIGGTFTDVVVQDEDGGVRTWKVPSTPEDFADGVLNGIAVAAGDLDVEVSDLLARTGDFVHGTTVTTNIVVTRSGVRSALLTTAGFGDGYALARMYRGSEQDPAKVTHPVPLIPRHDVEEVRERIDYQGRVVLPLDETQLAAAVRRLLDNGIESFAVCFLWSFINPEHERRAREVVREMAPGSFVAISSETCPIIGEYERTSTTAITAFAGPALRGYATSLERRLAEKGLQRPMLLMKSDGGVGSIDAVVRAAAQTVYSGPAAGVMGASRLVDDAGLRDLITFDMGGTSTDVALLEDGQVRTTSMQFLDRQALATPMIDISTVGAGGGSIGWVSTDGELRVGPDSAGARPGPACYGRGGTRATVTDANVVLGLIDPAYFLGGTFVLQADRAHAAVAELAAQVGLTTGACARGMVRVVNAVMADAIRLRTVFAGLDPRRFALVSFGGAGGLHCATVARELRIGHVVVPRLASVFSAFGLVSSDLVYSYARSQRRDVGPGGALAPADLDAVNAAFAELDERALAELEAHDLDARRVVITHGVELSYAGQILDFSMPVPRRILAAEDITAIIAEFDERYAAVYGPGAAAPDAGYALKTYTVKAVGGLDHPPSQRPVDAAGTSPAPHGTRRAFPDLSAPTPAEVAVYRGVDLAPRASLPGPALLDFADTTVLVPDGSTASIDDSGNVHLRLSA